jgi:hypothetical protein
MKWLCPAITSGNPDIERNERRGIASRGDGGLHYRLHLLCVPGVGGKPVDPKYLLKDYLKRPDQEEAEAPHMNPNA